MLKKMICMACLVLGFWGAEGAAAAEIIIQYDADLTTDGAIQNPSVQGWEETGTGDGVVVEGVVDNGVNAWRILDDVSNLNPQYTLAMTTDTYQAMYEQGWTYEFVTRGVSGGFTGWGLTTATDPGWGLTTRERVGFGIGASGDAFSISPIHGNAVTLGGGSASEFHTIRCVGKPYSSEYEFMIDGVSYGTYDIKDGTSNSSFDNVFRFVSGSTAGTGRETLWNFVGLGIGELRMLAPELAADPMPVDASDDVPSTVTLNWASGEFSGTHDVYFGTVFEDVDSAGVNTPLDVLLAQGYELNAIDMGRLEFGETYYWRVDEVNSTPDKTVFKGDVWSFTVEPYSILISPDQITATASSVSNEFSTPDKTIDGSGLDVNGAHAITPEEMWFSDSVDLDPWIQYEFDAVKQLDTMKVWNSNSAAEAAIGWGIKDVEIAYSVDGETWDVLADANQFSRAPGSPTYSQYDEIAFEGVAARYVRLNIGSNWGGILMAYGLSEVQFSMIPAQARTPVPESGAGDVLPNAIVAWRSGRSAAQSTVYVSTDPNEVADGMAPSATSTTNSIDLSAFDLEMGKTYYWRVDEVNHAEAVPVWAGPVWSLSTVDSLIVDDFESYTNFSPDRPFQTWLDGFGYSEDEFFPVGYEGNGTGSGVGHDIWSLSSPYYNGDIMETTYTLPGSSQSMPIYYTNVGSVASQTERTFAEPQDWTVGGAKTLSIAFRGNIGNAGSLYVKINDTKLTYPHADSNLAWGAWQAWNIDLSSMDVQNVTKLQIGVEGMGVEGLLYVDDIRLYPTAGELITPKAPGDDHLAGAWSFDEGAGSVAADISGHGRTGTIVDATWDAGQQGSALSFNGMGAYVNIDGYKGINADRSDPNNPVQRAFTVAGWVNTEADGALVTWGSSDSAGIGGQYQSFRIDGGTLRAEHGNGNYRGATPVSDGEWHHVALTVAEGANLQPPQNQLYVDGVGDSLRASGNSQNIYNLTEDADVSIGRRASHNDRFFTGLIDEVRIYDRALSLEEVLWLAGKTEPIAKPF